MAKQATELMYAVRFRLVFKYFRQLCLVLAVLTLVPLGVSILFGDTISSEAIRDGKKAIFSFESDQLVLRFKSGKVVRFDREKFVRTLA